MEFHKTKWGRSVTLQDIIVNAEGNIQHNKYNIPFVYLKKHFFQEEQWEIVNSDNFGGLGSLICILYFSVLFKFGHMYALYLF